MTLMTYTHILNLFTCYVVGYAAACAVLVISLIVLWKKDTLPDGIDENEV